MPKERKFKQAQFSLPTVKLRTSNAITGPNAQRPTPNTQLIAIKLKYQLHRPVPLSRVLLSRSQWRILPQLLAQATSTKVSAPA